MEPVKAPLSWVKNDVGVFTFYAPPDLGDFKSVELRLTPTSGSIKARLCTFRLITVRTLTLYREIAIPIARTPI